MPRKNKHADNNAWLKNVVNDLYAEVDKRQLVLTAVVTAVEERVGEDIILLPRSPQSLDTQAVLYTQVFQWQNTKLRRHFIIYRVPDVAQGHLRNRNTKEFLRVTLDIAHELGHLLLEAGPGRLPYRIGVPQSDLEAMEVEADWFALCVLQMYGFVFPVKSGE